MLAYGEVSFIYISYQYTGDSVYLKMLMKQNFKKDLRILKQILIPNLLVKDSENFCRISLDSLDDRKVNE